MKALMDKKEVSFSSLSDQALLASIGAKDSDATEANKAFELFHQRHSAYLWKLCKIVCLHHANSDELAKELFQETMVKVYFNASTFDSNKGGAKTWLSRIAKNEFINILRRGLGSYLFLDVSTTDSFLMDDTLEEQEKDIEPTMMEKGLNSLSEKERYILVTYMMYYDQDSPNRHLPDKQLMALSQAVGASPESIRQIKSRAMKKLKKFLTENR